jgi:hypothetical protein
MPFIIESQRDGRAGARRLAVAAAVVSVAFAIGSVLVLAGTADAATGAGLAVGSPAASATWKIQSTPNPSGSDGNNLEGVSCTSATACTAVGYYYSPSGSVITLAEQWNGTTWTIHTGPTVTSLNGVSCTSASACTAVGSVLSNSGDVVTRAERWNGTSWTTQTTPNPSGAGSSQLNGVSCTSASACTAVGYYYNTSGIYFTLAEGWNGKSWTIQATPKPTGSSQPELEGVSCTSASACTAVGGYEDSSGADRTLADGWNGTSWTTHATTNPGPESDYLYGASCTSASACTAVGYKQLSSGRLVTLAERWNGTSWTTQTTPNPSGPDTNVFSGVSCASASACTAVGYYDRSNAEPTAPFAEGWNGTTWTVQTTPSPAGTDDSPLNGVSCTAASTCTAVGEYQDSSGTYLTLAERESG